MNSLRKAKPGETNFGLVDRYTVLHVVSGFGAGLVGVPLWGIVAVGALFELAEDPLKQELPDLFPDSSQDTVTNSIGDFIAFTAGGIGGRVVHFLFIRPIIRRLLS